jgi:hypothetical protein
MHYGKPSMEGMVAYCPYCDAQHAFRTLTDGIYRCRFTHMFSLSSSMYIGGKRRGEGCTCLRSYCSFGDDSLQCDVCGLVIKLYHYEFLMPRFTKGIWKQVRGFLDISPQVRDHLRNTFPRRFAEIVAESDAINATALAPHLPPVLAGIVAEYFG